jgi:hypothetical protein
MSSLDICEDVCDRMFWTLERFFLTDWAEILVLRFLWLPVELREVPLRMGSAFRALLSTATEGAHLA